MRGIFNTIFSTNLNQKISVPKPSSLLRALEPRVLLDAAAAETSFDLADRAVLEQQADDYIGDGIDFDAIDAAYEALEADAIAPPLERERRDEFVFIDAAVENKVELIASIDPSATIIILDGDKDGLEQIAETVKFRENLSAIHIISHGDAGSLNLGSSQLTNESILGDHADELAIIKNSLSIEADILIYGCNFGQGEEGLLAVQNLANATGADIAASDDLTGAKSLNGDWDLEINLGDIETQSVEARNFDGILVAVDNSISVSENGFVQFDPMQDTEGAGRDKTNDTNASITAVTQGAKGTVSIVDGEVKYVANEGEIGADSFTYTFTANGVDEVANVTVEIAESRSLQSGDVRPILSHHLTGEENYTAIKINEIPTGSSLTLNGTTLFVGDIVYKADIDALRFKMNAPTDFIGTSKFSYDVIVPVELTSVPLRDSDRGDFKYFSTARHIRDDSNFGIGGTVNRDFRFNGGPIAYSGQGASFIATISETHLERGEITFIDRIHGLAEGSGDTIYNWVEGGGLAIVSGDSVDGSETNRDRVFERFGLSLNRQNLSDPSISITAGGNAANHAILNGPFGTLQNGDAIATISSPSWFNSEDVLANDVVLAQTSEGKPIMILRQVGAGHVLLNAAPDIFDSGSEDSSTFNNTDILVNNIFAFLSAEADVNDDTRDIFYEILPGVDVSDNSIKVHENGFVQFDPTQDTLGAGRDSSTDPNAAITAITQGAKGSVSIENGLVKYVPNEGATGNDSFTYTLTSNGVETVATVNVEVLEILSVAVDNELTLNSANLAGGDNYSGLKFTDIPSGTKLSVNGTLLTNGDTVSKADIDAGNLTYQRPPNYVGTSKLLYEILPIITLLEGKTDYQGLKDSDATSEYLSETNRHIRDDRNFSANGIVKRDFDFVEEQNTIDEAYLNQGDIYFSFHATPTTAEADTVYDWVTKGGLAIFSEFEIYYEAYLKRFGLNIITGNFGVENGSRAAAGIAADHPILDGPFGTLSGGDVINGRSYRSFDPTSLNENDIILSYVEGDVTQPNIILRQVGQGYALFSFDLDLFRSGNDDPTQFNNADIFINNLFAFMSEQAAGEQVLNELAIEVTPPINGVSVREGGFVQFDPTIDTEGSGEVLTTGPKPSLQSVTQGEKGTVSIVGDQIKYVPNADATGSDRFTYTLNVNGTDEVLIAEVTILDNISVNEDVPKVLSSLDLTAEENYTAVKITDLPDNGILSVNGTPLELGDRVSKLDIDAGNFTFQSAADYNGNTEFSYEIIPIVNLLAGNTNVLNIADNDSTAEGVSQTNIHIRDDRNFGANGTIKRDFNLIQDQTTIDAAYLNQGDIFTSAYSPVATAADADALYDWVNNGGLAVVGADNNNADLYATRFGLPIENTRTTNDVMYITSDSAVLNHPILNGEFGTLSGGTAIAGFQTNSWFNPADIDANDLVLAYNNNNKPTLVLRQVGQGYVLITADEGIFRSGTNNATTFNNQDILVNNIFAFMSDKAVEGKTNSINGLSIDIAPLRDAVVDTIRVHEDGFTQFDPLKTTLEGEEHSFTSPSVLTSAVSDGAHGTVTLVDGEIKYVADQGYTGTDSFTYTNSVNGVDEVTTVSVEVVAHETLIEDTPKTLTGSSFTNETEYSGIKITNIEFIEGSTLTLDGVAVTPNTMISKSDIDAGLLVYTPAEDYFGEDGLELSYQIIPLLRVLEGNTSNYTIDNTTDANATYAPVNLHLLSEQHFGANGMVKNQIEFVPDQNNVDRAYLESGDVYFGGGYVLDTEVTDAEADAVYDWVNEGGFFLGHADNSDADKLATRFGLPASNTQSTATWTPSTDLAALNHPIFDGVFGDVSIGDTISSTASGRTFNLSDINTETDIVLAYSNGDISKPTLVLRQVGEGYALIASNENFYTAGTRDASTFNANDIIINNFIAWASESIVENLDKPSEKLVLDVISADDDFDLDGIEDDDDLDDDNDGILDVDEPSKNYISKNVSLTDGSEVTHMFPHINGETLFNISELDESVTLVVNGDTVGGNELNFYPTSNGIGVVFANGEYMSTVWEQHGSAEDPIVQFKISEEGEVKIFGRNNSGVLEQMFLQNGVTINDVPINKTSDNIIKVDQYFVSGITRLDGIIVAPSNVYDTDSDGSMNHVDLDSDNDGISDLYESGFVRAETARLNDLIEAGDEDAAAKLVELNTIVADGKITFAESKSYGMTQDTNGIPALSNGDADGDGILDIFDHDNTSTSIENSLGTTSVDTDADGIKDIHDLDSDGDGISDFIEAKPTAGSVTTNGIFSTPIDSDRDGLEDYRDLDSDGDGISDKTESGQSFSGMDANFDGIDDGLNTSYQNPDGNIDNTTSIFDVLKNTETFDNEEIEVDFRDAAPSAFADTVNVTEDETLNVSQDMGLLANDTDSDFDALTVISFSVAGIAGDHAVGSPYLITDVGSLSLESDGSFSFAPSKNYEGEVPTITYKIKDADGNVTSSTLTLDVINVNDTPTSTALSNQTAEDNTTFTIDVSSHFSDVDEDTLTFSATGLPENISISSNGVISGIFDKNASQGGDDGVYTVSVTAKDPSKTFTTQDFTFTITNPAPVANDDGTATIVEDHSLNVTAANGLLANDSDKDGDDLSIKSFAYGGVNKLAGETLEILNVGNLTVNSDGSYDFVPVDNYYGEIEDVQYFMEDADKSASDAVFSLSVLSENDAPTSSALPNQTADDGAFVPDIDVFTHFADADGEALLFSATGLPNGLEISNDGIISGTIAPNSAQGGNGGIYRVVVTAKDPAGVETTQSFTFRVNNIEGAASTDNVQGNNLTLTDNSNKNSFQLNASLENPGGLILNTVQNIGGLNGEGLSNSFGNEGIGGDKTRSIFNQNGEYVQSTNFALNISVGGEENFTRVGSGFLDDGLFTADETPTEKMEIVLNTYVRNHTLYIDLMNYEGAVLNGNSMSYKIAGLENRPLPDWIKMAGDGLIIAEYPVNAKSIEFMLQIEMADGKTVEEAIRVDHLYGVIEVTKLSPEEPISNQAFSGKIKTLLSVEN